MTNALKILRMNLLGGMNTYVRNFNDEDGIMLWLMNGVPDCATEDDLESIAEDDEVFCDVCALFGKLVKKYGKDMVM